jgi:hypothetical protein
MSPNYCTWNIHGLFEFSHWCKRGLIKGLENCVIHNIVRAVWMPPLILSHPARRAGNMWLSSIRLHWIRVPAQVCHKSSWPKVPCCWDRDKLCVDPFCHTWALTLSSVFAQRKDFYSITRINIKISFQRNMFLRCGLWIAIIIRVQARQIARLMPRSRETPDRSELS